MSPRRVIRLAALAVVFVILAGTAVGIWSVQRVYSAAAREARANDLRMDLAALQRRLLDAETGQRGFLISGDERYLTPYSGAIGEIVPMLDRIEAIASGSPTAARLLPELRRLVAAKLSELAETIAVRRANGFAAARALVLTNVGKTTMDDIRAHVDSLTAEQHAVVTAETAASAVSARAAILVQSAAGLVGVVLVAIGLWAFERVLAALDARERSARELLQATADAARARSRLNDVVANVPSVVWEAWVSPTPPRRGSISSATTSPQCSGTIRTTGFGSRTSG